MAGRPSTYSQEIADTICGELIEGRSMRSIRNDPGMPSRRTIFDWLLKYEDFRDQYTKARQTQADVLFDEILDIADDSANDFMERENKDGSISSVENPEAIRRSMLRVETRKWVVSKLLPKKYGERVTNILEGGDNPLRLAGDMSVLSDEQLEQLRSIAYALAAPKSESDS